MKNHDSQQSQKKTSAQSCMNWYTVNEFGTKTDQHKETDIDLKPYNPKTTAGDIAAG